MRRFELSEGSSNKFWQIELQGKSFTVNFGRIGTSGQSQTKSFDTDAKAKTEHDKLVAEKVKKGYAEVQASGSLVAVAPKPAAEKKPSAPATETRPAPVETPSPVAEAPSAPPPSSDVPHVAWTPAALARCAPTTRSELVKAQLPTAAAAWKQLHKTVTAVAPLLSLGGDPALTERVRGAYEADAAPTERDVTVHAAAWALYGPARGWGDDSNDLAIAAYLTAQFGLDFMLECFTAVPKAVSSYNARHLGGDAWTRVSHDAWRALSRCWLAATDAQRAAALPAVKAWVESTPNAERRAALAVMIDDDVGLARAVAVLAANRSRHDGSPLERANSLTAASVEQVKDRLTGGAGFDWYSLRQFEELQFDLLLRFGVALTPLLIEATEEASQRGLGADSVRSIASALALIVSPECATWFAGQLGSKEVRPVASEYLAKYPALAIAAVADVAVGRGAAAGPAGSLFRGFVASAPELVKRFEPGACAAVKALIAEVHAANAVTDAPDAMLPLVLRDPPWKRTTRREALGVFEVTIPPVPPTLRDSLRAQLKSEGSTHYAETPDGADELKRTLAGEKKGNWSDNYSSSVFLKAPAAVALKAFNTEDLSKFGWSYYPIATSMLERHGVEVVPGLLNLVDVSMVDAIDALYFVDGSAPAVAMARAAAKSKKLRSKAQAWLLRQPRTAAVGLIPAAVGPVGATRTAAEESLRFIAKNGHREVIEAVARDANALEATQAVLDFDPLLILPKKLPALPPFFTPGAFTRPRLKDRQYALPLATLEHVGLMLAISSVDAPYEGVVQLKEACDPRTLAQFSWELFQAWSAAGNPSKEGWAFQQLGLLGDDEVARQLTPLIRQWPGEAAHTRAVSGLDVLARIGSDVALMNLHGIAQKVKFKGLQEKAREKIAQVADQRGFTADELADRLVPDLGLDDDGTLWLDFGPRKFKVVFDESLKPFVLAEGAGKPVDLPKPKQSDDAEKAAAAVEQWKAMKKDAKTIAEGQVRRLELAMCSQRRWEREVFEQFLVGHPLMIHLARRLVWGVYGEGDALSASFRVAEDRSLADAHDETYQLPAGARVGVVHRLELDDALAGQWGQVFADYELLQPFEQLSRAAFSLGALATATELDRVKGLDLPTGKVLGLDAHGWRRGPPQDGGVTCWYEKKVSAGTVLLDLDPGIFTGMLSESPRQKLGLVTLGKEGGWWRKEEAIAFGKLSRVEASELLRDLESLKES